MPAIDFEQALNTEQLPAIAHGEGPQLVLAGAGSGKTRVITYRVAWLVRERGIDPARIAAVTFTNKAAGEMKGRVEELLAIYPLPAFVGTFHRFALRLLRAYGGKVGLSRGFTILDASDQLSLLKKAMKAEELSTDAYRPRAVLAAISSAKNRLLSPRHFEAEADDFYRGKVVAPAYRRYQALMHEAGGIDFDDMIRLAVELLRDDKALKSRLRDRFRYLMVDEFQDTNHAQLQLIFEISGAAGNLTAVGDEDQGIYRWRGAELDNILDFEKSFPRATIRKLERNYRSTQNILDASGALVANNANRRGKRLWTDAGAGDKLTVYRARDELTKPAGWRTCCAGSRRITCSQRWRSWYAPTPRPAPSKSVSTNCSCPISWSVACVFTSARKSRIWSPTCASLDILTTRCRWTESSTGRPGASARKPATGFWREPPRLANRPGRPWPRAISPAYPPVAPKRSSAFIARFPL